MIHMECNFKITNSDPRKKTIYRLFVCGSFWIYPTVARKILSYQIT